MSWWKHMVLEQKRPNILKFGHGYKTQVTTFDPCTVRNFFTTIWRLGIEIMMCVKIKSTCNQNLIFNFFSFTILVRTFNMPIIIGYIHAIYDEIMVLCAWLLDISKNCGQISWMHRSSHPLKQVWCEKCDYLLYTGHFRRLCEHSSLLLRMTQPAWMIGSHQKKSTITFLVRYKNS